VKTLGVKLVVLAFGIVAAFLLVVAGASSYSPATVNASTTTRIDFPQQVNTITRYSRAAYGIYILRDHWASVGGNFVGDIDIDRSSFTQTNWRFEAVHSVNGEFVPTSTFIVDRTLDRNSATFLFPKSARAGLYAIRATALMPAPSEEVFLEHGSLPIIRYYYILYAEEFSHITITDVNTHDNRHNLRAQGASRDLSVRVAPNAGAMDIESMQPMTGNNMGNLFDRMVATINVDLWEMDFRVTRDGFATTAAIEVHPSFINPGTFDIVIPQTLPTGLYTITFTHELSPHIFGTFIIDNRVTLATPRSLNGLALFFLIFGTLLAIGAAFLFAAPKVLHAMQEKKYKNAQFQRHAVMADRVNNKQDKRVKAQSANDALKSGMGRKDGDPAVEGEEGESDEKKQKRANSFLSKMQESKQRREWAREQGMTMDEFREMEAKREKIEDSKNASLSEFRGDRAQIAEYVQTEAEKQEEIQKSYVRRLSDGTEMEMLDSVREHAVVADEEYQANVVQPNQDAPQTGILGRLRNFTGEDN